MINYDDFKMGYILAYKTDNSLFSKAIVARQKRAGFNKVASQIVHVEISGGNIHSINIAPPFSRLVEIDKKHDGRYVYLLRYKNKDYEEKGRYKVAYFSAALCANKGYDIPGVLSFLYKWIDQNNRLFFCSEGVLMALQKVYPKVMDYLKPEECMPADFMNKNYFEIVWKGFIPK